MHSFRAAPARCSNPPSKSMASIPFRLSPSGTPSRALQLGALLWALAGMIASPAAMSVPQAPQHEATPPRLPSAATVARTPADAAALGAGQTIYLIVPASDPHIVAELAFFNKTWSLPDCAAAPVSATLKLPLPPADPEGGCSLLVVAAAIGGAAGGTSSVAHDTETASNAAAVVEWAHAIAPLARIGLIAPAQGASILDAIRLVNRMGPGAVSIDWAQPESAGFTAAHDSLFSAPSMTYFAPVGDNGHAVNWPAVSSRVVAVGGTSLRVGSNGARLERAWSHTGGGVSQFTAVPPYQRGAIPGISDLQGRAIPDVAFNADPNTGQLVAVQAQDGPGHMTWISKGGTNLAAAQWAGLAALASALRRHGNPAAHAEEVHVTLYQRIAAVPGRYAAAFNDVTAGSNGPCNTCGAHAGYDETTGLGTPNVGALLPLWVSSNSASVDKRPRRSVLRTVPPNLD